ncbi:Nucleoside-diphosphate-sugar epimerase protein [Rutstroemia sp. NJR-2017a BBW]|nr:Nucleoside-diphosphate-sugar epimerase protein [Rutstroemia sp. NJR-2017a BBW]
MPKIFIVGATGHIGGAVLELLYRKYPDVKIRALVRDEGKGERLRERYQGIETVLGDNAALDVLEREAREADVVLKSRKLFHLSSLHHIVHNYLRLPDAGPDVRQEPAISALLRGLSNRTPKPYYIHTSGGGLIWDEPNGEPTDKIWDDVDDIQEMQSLPSSYIHATPDAPIHPFLPNPLTRLSQLVFSHSPTIHTAIVSPTIVYGLSPSHDHPTPVTLPMALNQIQRLGQGFTVGPGDNIQAYVHTVDMARLYLLLLDQALSPSPSNPDPSLPIFGPQAYYFAASEELPARDYMSSLIDALTHNQTPSLTLKSSEIIKLDHPEISRSTLTKDPDVNAKVLFGMNMRVKSTRAERVLGWRPVEGGVLEGLREVVGVWGEGERSRGAEKGKL